MVDVRQFTDPHLVLLDQVTQRAEDLTGDYYHLGSFGPRRYVYEVATEGKLEAEEMAPEAFAQLSRYVAGSPSPGARQRVGRFYRVCLQDNNILAATKREDVTFGLETLLLYIMTHELIHIVRFERFQHPFLTKPAEREAEEQVVHGITYDLLSQQDDVAMAALLEYYRHHRMPRCF